MTRTERKLLLKLANLVIDDLQYDPNTTAKDLYNDLIEMRNIVDTYDGDEIGE
jgi:hypothetical protein